MASGISGSAINRLRREIFKGDTAVVLSADAVMTALRT
jgi:hypothetical protein